MAKNENEVKNDKNISLEELLKRIELIEEENAKTKAENAKLKKLSEGKTPEKTPSRFNERVPMRLFYDGEAYKEPVFACVNGRRFQIKRGVTVSVPAPIAAVIDSSATQDDLASRLIKQLEGDYEAKNVK